MSSSWMASWSYIVNHSICWYLINRMPLPTGAKEPFKYPLGIEPSYVKEIKKKVAVAEPPVFATQGEPTGKTRGRKPQKPKAKPAPKRSRTSSAKRAQPKRSKRAATKPKPKAKARAARGKARAAPKRSAPASGSVSKRLRKASVGSGDANQDALRVPPAHVTHNHIYSSAYRKSLSLFPNDAALAQKRGKEAIEFFKETGNVNGLCGAFRSKTRKNQPAKDVD